MEKEIEEISDIISDCIEFVDEGGGSVSVDEDMVAETLYNAGYGKVDDYKKEIERLRKVLCEDYVSKKAVICAIDDVEALKKLVGVEK